MRTVVYGNEDIYAYHVIKNGERKAIVVDKNGEEVNVVFQDGEEIGRIFDYWDWVDLDYYFNGNK